MTAKEFRRLSRKELIDIIFELQKEQEATRNALQAAQAQLADRELKLANVGSIAEAALSLQDVFVRAQAAADQYVAEVKRLYGPLDAQAQQPAGPEPEADAMSQAEAEAGEVVLVAETQDEQDGGRRIGCPAKNEP